MGNVGNDHPKDMGAVGTETPSKEVGGVVPLTGQLFYLVRGGRTNVRMVVQGAGNGGNG